MLLELLTSCSRARPGDHAVSTAQSLLQFVSDDVLDQLGSASSVHAAMVCDKKSDGTVEIAHVTNAGGKFSYARLANIVLPIYGLSRGKMLVSQIF
jgi:hypothetical protein